MVDEEWRTQVIQKLNALFTDKDQLAKILQYLVEEERVANGIENSPVWKMLRDLLHMDETFIGYAKRFLQTMEKEEQPTSDSMLVAYNEMELQAMKITHGSSSKRNSSAAMSGMTGLSRALATLPVSRGAGLVKATNGVASKASMAIAVAFVTFETITILRRWWNKEVTGKRVFKNLIDSYVSVGGGVAGAMAGAAAGAPLGPVGIVLGGLAGGIVGNLGTAKVSDFLTQELFDIPKAEALERAYNFLGVSKSATDIEINAAFERLYHQYKSSTEASENDLMNLKTCMGIIKVAREAL